MRVRFTGRRSATSREFILISATKAVEWLWRTLMYGVPQPMLLSPTEQAA